MRLPEGQRTKLIFSLLCDIRERTYDGGEDAYRDLMVAYGTFSVRQLSPRWGWDERRIFNERVGDLVVLAIIDELRSNLRDTSNVVKKLTNNLAVTQHVRLAKGSDAWNPYELSSKVRWCEEAYYLHRDRVGKGQAAHAYEVGRGILKAYADCSTAHALVTQHLWETGRKATGGEEGVALRLCASLTKVFMSEKHVVCG